jgi:hypothetical protein
MTVFLVETYVIKPEKRADFAAYIEKEKRSEILQKLPQFFKEAKSYKMFAQMLGGNWEGYVEMWEFENLADCEKFFNKTMQSDYMTTLYPEFTSLVVPATHSMNIWNSVT